MNLQDLCRKLAKPVAIPLIAGAIGGYIASELTSAERIRHLSEKEARKFRVEFHLSGNRDSLHIPDTFSRNEKFMAGEPEYRPSSLDTKIGFRFEAEEVVEKKTDPSLPDIGLSSGKYGTAYAFSISKFFHDPPEQTLIISYYCGGIFGSSSVFITDKDNDLIPDLIWIHDQVNNTEIWIRRNMQDLFSAKSHLTYENINEEGAKKLFDLYTAEYLRFRETYDIEQRIHDYTPKLEIQQVDISGMKQQ
ncbi:MAG: hypothetical protein V1743_05480 [Nanoarchaeota archaeon]